MTGLPVAPVRHSIVPFICSAISSSAKCLRVSKTEIYGLSRICCEMTRQAKMPSLSEKCLRVSKTESYGLSRICFEMKRQATMPSLKAWHCLADKQHTWPKVEVKREYCLCGVCCSNSQMGSVILWKSQKNYALAQSFSDQAISSDSDWSLKFGLGLKKSWLSYTLTQNYQSMKYL
jgi:hypothetical protein